MKKFLFYICFTFLLFSCSNVAEVQTVSEKTETLKELIVTKEADISWTKELEEHRLVKDIKIDEEYISSDIPIVPEVYITVHKNDEPVYPSLRGFCSLDIRKLPSNIYSLISDFCDSLSKNIYNGPQAYFDSKYIFNYVFFKNDLINSWQDKFGVEFPQKIITEPNVEADNNDSKDKKEVNKMPQLFTKWIIGEPFVGEEILQVPVRFYCNEAYVDVTLYISFSNNKIYQITEGLYGGTK